MPSVSSRHEPYNRGLRGIGERVYDWSVDTQQTSGSLVHAVIACQYDVARRKLGLPPVLQGIQVDGLNTRLAAWQEEFDLTDLEILAILGDLAEREIWRLVRDERRTA